MVDEKEKKSLQDKNKSTDKTVEAKQSSSKLGLIFLFLLFVAVAGGFFYLYKTILGLQSDIAQIKIVNAKDFERQAFLIENNYSAYIKLKNRLDEIEQNINLQKKQVFESETKLASPNKEYVLADIEYLLNIANYKLQLSSDISSALLTLEMVDARLADINSENSAKLRAQLSADISNLRSVVAKVDLGEIGRFLYDTSMRVDSLLLKDEVVMDAKTDDVDKDTSNKKLASFDQFMGRVWGDLKSLVVITRNDKASSAILQQEEIDYLKVKLQLELVNTRFAVFNRDTSSFVSSVGLIQKVLEDYFDLSDIPTKNIYNFILEIKGLDLAFPDVNIDSSIELVRAMIFNNESIKDVEINMQQPAEIER